MKVSCGKRHNIKQSKISSCLASCRLALTCFNYMTIPVTGLHDMLAAVRIVLKLYILGKILLIFGHKSCATSSSFRDMVQIQEWD